MISENKNNREKSLRVNSPELPSTHNSAHFIVSGLKYGNTVLFTLQ